MYVRLVVIRDAVAEANGFASGIEILGIIVWPRHGVAYLFVDSIDRAGVGLNSRGYCRDVGRVHVRIFLRVRRIASTHDFWK